MDMIVDQFEYNESSGGVDVFCFRLGKKPFLGKYLPEIQIASFS